MIIAVEGCGHGELDQIYASIEQTEQRNGIKVDLLLVCGDFQAVRNHADLATMACPPKYRQIGGFYRYYSGEKVAPVLTIFIGGNHEASNHLWELFYGGWAAPNIYFLGCAGVVNVGGVRIGGASGIYNKRHYQAVQFMRHYSLRHGHYEVPPYSDDDMRSTYHLREMDVLRLLQLEKPLDVFMSHDWPQHIARHGDTQALFRKKPFLQSEVQDGSLGSPPAMQLLQHLKPSYWFAAHLHVKFAAAFPHEDGRTTRFLSLDKSLPNRDFLQLIQVRGDGSPVQLCYDAEWIAVLRSTAAVFSVERGPVRLSPASIAHVCGGRSRFTPTEEEMEQVAQLASDKSLKVPLNFCITAEPHRPGDTAGRQSGFSESPQTTEFVRRFGLPEAFRSQKFRVPPPPPSVSAATLASGVQGGLFESMPLEEEIDLGDD